MFSKISVMANCARLNSDAWPRLASSTFKFCLWALILIGIVARIFPLIDPAHRLFWQYMTEDGYLMQTIARNIALGLGMSTADGTIPTNGVQPLATFMFAVMHFIAGESKFEGIVLVTLFSVLVSIVSGYYAYKVGKNVLTELKYGRELSMISAALWFSAPHTIRDSMNGLETGVYFMVLLITLDYYLVKISVNAKAFGLKQKLALGFLLGLCFLARNDAVFFIGGLLLAHLVLGADAAEKGYRNRLIDCLVTGITSIVVALPWIVNNYVRFGSIMPISGLAESRNAHFAQNLPFVPANLFSSTFIYAPVPNAFQQMPIVVMLSILWVSIAIMCFWIFVARHTLVSRRYFLTCIIFTAGISAFYGLFFGVPDFLHRYMAPLSPFLWLASCTAVYFFAGLFFRTFKTSRIVITSCVLILTIGAAVFALTDFKRGYAKGTAQMHRQVVQWVQNNVPESQWVGSPQSGTLGFFHDRTLNLDGKVNPFALHAILEDGNVLEYARNSRIEYIPDWYGVAGWTEMKSNPQFGRDFKVIVRDKQLNLSVMRRIEPVQ